MISTSDVSLLLNCMQHNTHARPGAVEFLQMWKHFNEMAHESGIVRKALQNHQQNESAWLNYYLYFNHFEAVGQTLLVYCLRELLDIAATHHFSAFDLTGYLLESEEEHHLGEQGTVRQALQDEDILQFVSVRDQQELKRVLPKLIKAEGSLKVLVLPVLEQRELEKYRQKIEQKLLANPAGNGLEFVVLIPHVVEGKRVIWHYLHYNGNQQAEITSLQ